MTWFYTLKAVDPLDHPHTFTGHSHIRWFAKYIAHRALARFERRHKLSLRIVKRTEANHP